MSERLTLFTLLLETLKLEQRLSFNIQMTVEVKLCKFTLKAKVIHIVTHGSLDFLILTGQLCHYVVRYFMNNHY